MYSLYNTNIVMWLILRVEIPCEVIKTEYKNDGIMEMFIGKLPICKQQINLFKLCNVHKGL